MNILRLAIITATLGATTLNLTACQSLSTSSQTASSGSLQSDPLSENDIENEQQKASLLIEEYDTWILESSPMLQSYRGLKTNYNKWDNLSAAFEEKQLQDAKTFVSRLAKLRKDALPASLSLSIDVLTFQLTQYIDGQIFRHHSFPMNQLFGLHTEIPNFLINIHQIDTIGDAHAYIERVTKISTLMKQQIEQLKIQEDLGIFPPDFVYESVITASKQLLTGAPLDNMGSDHIILADFKRKITGLQLFGTSRSVLENKLNKALKRKFQPAYRSLINHLRKSRQHAAKDTGIHQYINGEQYYAHRLGQSTTTDWQAEQIHQLGLQHISRIHQEITKLLPKLGSQNLKTLFERTRSDNTLFYHHGDQALADSKARIKEINGKLGEAFSDIPNIPMVVKPVEAFRVSNSPIAFYQSPSDTGERPGTYYMNLGKLKEMPAFQFEALAYHETIPGHHLQSIYALNAKDLPQFRRRASFTAYTEGWALYAEGLAKELGAYQDPWSEYGRLLMELWRAARLVIDTGLHAKGWTLQQAIAFRLDNTPFSHEDSVNAVKRYIVMPGQATAYMIGKLRFDELRTKAESALGERFHLGDYHKFILSLGPLPLTLLERSLDQWLQDQGA